MEEAIQAQLKKLGLPPQQVTVLILDKCSASKLTGLNAFGELTKLSINGAGVSTLENFPHLPKLTKVIIINIILGFVRCSHSPFSSS
jgi:acidic leucine-rich nuclear phosphoprotein 32 family member A/C/D